MVRDPTRFGAALLVFVIGCSGGGGSKDEPAAINDDAECRAVLADLISQCDAQVSVERAKRRIDDETAKDAKRWQCGSPRWTAGYAECARMSSTARRLIDQLDAYWHDHKPATQVDEPSDEIEHFADRACACKDKTCATKVADEFAGWLKANKNARGDEDQAAKDGERMFKCLSDKGADMSKLMEAAAEVGK